MSYAEIRRTADEAGAKLIRPESRGVGFAKLKEVNDYLLAAYRGEFKSKVGRVGIFEVEQIDAKVESKNGDGSHELVTVQPGDIVYLGIHTADLREKITDDLKGHRLLVAYIGTKPVRTGDMKLYDVRDLGEVEVDDNDDDLPF
jgi:hypothetical protein